MSTPNVSSHVAGLADLLALPRGARFHRADLHVHSFGASTDVRDTAMTPEKIVETALAQNLGLVAITDHNEISNISSALLAAEGTSILVVPGVELSTPQGHLLAYLPTLRALERFFGGLDILDRGEPESRCQNSIVDCLNRLQSAGGFGVLAHVDAGGGFEANNPGGSPHKIDVLCHRALLGIELKNAKSPISYNPDDPDPIRAGAGKERISRLGLGAKQYLARVLFSDSHSLQALGHNAAGDKRVTRVKMDSPSFEGLRIALEDSDARVRIEDLVPSSVPHILGVRFSGGFLDAQEIPLCPNLNCIIGGRGTGKSLTFEALHCLSGSPSDSSVVDSEVWPAELCLYWQDTAGEKHSLQKLLGEPLVNLDDALLGPVEFRVDCYGQGETTTLSKRAQDDPLALLAYLDRFTGVEDAVREEEGSRHQLLSFQSKIAEAELKVAQIPQYERSLATTRQQLAASEKAKAAEVIQLQRKLADEREVRRRLLEEWKEARALLLSRDAKQRLEAIKNIADPSDLTIGQAELRSILAAATLLEDRVSETDREIHSEVTSLDATVAEQIGIWKGKDVGATQEIEAKRKELEAQGVRLDMAFIQKLARDEASYKKALDGLRAWKAALVGRKAEYRKALRARWAARDRVATLREAYARQASKTLESILSDFQVALKFAANGLAPKAAEEIQRVMGWRTSQVPRAALLTERLTLPRLLDAIEGKNKTAITSLAFDDGTRPFSSRDAAEILERLGDQAVKFVLESCPVYDLPRLTVAKRVKMAAGTERHLVRDFSKLSLGQQQSILLSLLLSSENRDPLIVDQPEDNLDGEFIYSTFVPALRRAKERRQIIVVTHNANIAVLGDAEQIIVMKGHSDRGQVTARGSIDHEATREAACGILEGAREAFIRRARIYGVLSPPKDS